MDLEKINGSQEKDLFFADDPKLQTSDFETNNDKLSQVEKEIDTENISIEEKIVDDMKVESKEICENEIDKNLYDEILEKLDIKLKNGQQNTQEKSIQEKFNQELYLKKMNDIERTQTRIQIEKAISEDFSKIQELMKAKLINSVQGQNLKKQVLQKAFDKLVQTEKIKRALSPALIQNEQENKVINKKATFDEFSKNNPDFFTSEGRKEVLGYLNSNDVIIGKDELNKISEIIRVVEKAAIDRYIQKAAHEKNLRNSNESAKQRLTANAQKSSLSGNFSKTFTREQIGKMSSTEFAKYEAQIMEQLKKGLIR